MTNLPKYLYSKDSRRKYTLQDNGFYTMDNGRGGWHFEYETMMSWGDTTETEPKPDERNLKICLSKNSATPKKNT